MRKTCCAQIRERQGFMGVGPEGARFFGQSCGMHVPLFGELVFNFVGVLAQQSSRLQQTNVVVTRSDDRGGKLAEEKS